MFVLLVHIYIYSSTQSTNKMNDVFLWLYDIVRINLNSNKTKYINIAVNSVKRRLNLFSHQISMMDAASALKS